MEEFPLVDLLQAVLRVAIEGLDSLSLVFRLFFNLSLRRIVEMKMKTPELVLRRTNMYCCGLSSEVAGIMPTIKPSPSRKERMRIFLKAARHLSHWPTFLK